MSYKALKQRMLMEQGNITPQSNRNNGRGTRLLTESSILYENIDQPKILKDAVSLAFASGMGALNLRNTIRRRQ